VNSNCSPGYQAPYPAGNPPGAPSNSWYQLEGDTYAPFGAVLTNSTGDLIFGMNATCLPAAWMTGCAATSKHEIQSPLASTMGWDTWIILIPPEFQVPGSADSAACLAGQQNSAASGVGQFDSSQIVSTLTNSYDRYLVAKLGPDDRYAPCWTLVAISTDATVDSASASSATAGHGYYNHQYLNFTTSGEWYYARINGVTAIHGRTILLQDGPIQQQQYLRSRPNIGRPRTKQ